MEDWNEALYHYYKKTGGIFTGEIQSSYQECRLFLKYGEENVLLEPVIKGVGNGWITFRAHAVISGGLDKPFSLTIQPYGILKRAVELVRRQDIITGDKELDKRYLIRSSEPEFVKMSLNGSRLSQRLLASKEIEISVKPVKPGERLHMIEAVTKEVINENLVETQFCPSDDSLSELVELCRETWRTVSEYRMV